MKPPVQPEQAGCGEWPNSRFLRILVGKFLCIVTDTRAHIGLCLLVTSHGQIWYPWASLDFTIAHIVMGLSLHTHSFHSSKDWTKANSQSTWNNTQETAIKEIQYLPPHRLSFPRRNC